MAGFRTFATGEVLTAANVNNFLMGQSVMRFADADARTAALGADVVEGMLTYNLATDQLEVFDGTNFVVAAPEPPAGIGSNVVPVNKTDIFTTTATSYTTVTGLQATITPTSATSKILVLVTVNVGLSGNTRTANMRLVGGNLAFVGDAAGARIQATGAVGPQQTDYRVDNQAMPFGLMVVDAPATTAATTYSVEIAVAGGAGTVRVNASGLDIDAANFSRTASSITLIEVAA